MKNQIKYRNKKKYFYTKRNLPFASTDDAYQVKIIYKKAISSIFLLIIYLFLLINNFRLKYRKKKPKISLFLPIYNQEKYLTKCIQSIQNQTLKDIEIIAVNDHSTDNSLNILKKISKYDDRIKIVNNDKNHGLLYTRAMGIINTSGEYIMNVDADDELADKENLELLYKEILKTKADIIAFNIFDKKLNKFIKCQRKTQIQKQPKLFESIFGGNYIIEDYLIWNKLIKKEIFLKAYEFFKDEIYNGKWNYNEDEMWSILVNKYAENKSCVNKLVYIYNYNNDSLMNKRNGTILFQNFLYRHDMYKKIFIKKEEEKYLIAEYYFFLNWLEDIITKKHILIEDDKIKKNITNIFLFFMSNYKYSILTKNKINYIIKLVNK